VAHARPPVGEGRRPNAEEDAVLGRLGEAEIEDVLRTATIGRIGCRDGDSVYVVPISFVYADGCAYGHSAEGRQLTLMRATPEVCFEVEDVRRLSDWRTVVARGAFEELHGDDARAALDLLAIRFAPPGTRPDAGAPASSHGHSTSTPPVLFRIRLLSTTGRFESTELPHGSACGRGRLRS
jgi:nitroimidazol reductase NimA-like FMN-containing flavoprotein (pyridoxamine 5'-phosphate oxidase superfamily)